MSKVEIWYVSLVQVLDMPFGGWLHLFTRMSTCSLVPVPLRVLKRKHSKANEFFLFHEWTIRIHLLLQENQAKKASQLFFL